MDLNTLHKLEEIRQRLEEDCIPCMAESRDLTPASAEKMGRAAFARAVKGKQSYTPAQDKDFMDALQAHMEANPSTKMGASLPFLRAWSAGYMAAQKDYSDKEIEKLGIFKKGVMEDEELDERRKGEPGTTKGTVHKVMSLSRAKDALEKEFGIITKTQGGAGGKGGPKGGIVAIVKGKTYPVKDVLKKHGFKYLKTTGGGEWHNPNGLKFDYAALYHELVKTLKMGEETSAVMWRGHSIG